VLNYIKKFLARFLPAPIVREEIITVYRLDAEIFDQLQKQLRPARPTSELDAAYQLGLQVALQHIKDGVVKR
jgi:hypothetical protein